MPSPCFDFKRFRIWHDRCAMKVNTDAVLLATWAEVDGVQKVLDVGCGCGIIGLIVAQRAPLARVTGMDIDPEAAAQAMANALQSPFADRVMFSCCDVRDYDETDTFDCIFCNPPFYTEDTLPPDAQRSLARNASRLPFAELVSKVERLLSPGGRFHVVLPKTAEPGFTQLCLIQGLYPERQCQVRTTSRKAPKRTLCTYLKGTVQKFEAEEFVLMENGMRSEAYQRLTADFYLDDPQSS